jgi:hypothetical protein
LVVRQIAATVANDHYEKIIKKAYLIFVDNCKIVAWRNYDLISFMVNGMVAPRPNPGGDVPSEA